VRLYTPLLYYWPQRLGLQDSDTADLVQDVLLVLMRKLPEFEYHPSRRFRGWLRTVRLNKWRVRPHHAPAAPLDSYAVLAAPDHPACWRKRNTASMSSVRHWG
jgi:RNA polymerase sigma-70 factor (ECF subfamily)